MQYELHTPGDSKMVIPEAAKLVHQAGPNLPLRKPATQEAEFRQSVAQERLLANVSLFFGGLAAPLIAIGIYGTISYNIGRRTMEIGVRWRRRRAARGAVDGVVRELNGGCGGPCRRRSGFAGGGQNVAVLAARFGLRRPCYVDSRAGRHCGGNAANFVGRAFGAVAFVFKGPAHSSIILGSEVAQQPRHPDQLPTAVIPTTLTYCMRVVPSAEHKFKIDVGVAQVAGEIAPGVNLQARATIGAQVSYGF